MFDTLLDVALLFSIFDKDKKTFVKVKDEIMIC